MITQMEKKTNDKISAQSNQIICAGFVYHLGKATRRIVERSLDLEVWRGRVFRLWIGEDGKLTSDSAPRQFALLAEVEVPPACYRESGADDEGTPFFEREPLQLEQLEMKVWPLPE